MRIDRVLQTALNALSRNVMRAILTTLGIIIGIAAVIAMMEIGAGSTNAIQKTIAGMGANNLLVLPGAISTAGVSFGAGTGMTLTPQDCDAVLRECPEVLDAAPLIRFRTQIVYGNRNWSPIFMYGTTPAFLNVRAWNDLDEGAAFTDADVRNASKVCLIGKTVAQQLFDDDPPVGKEIRVQNVAFKVIGVFVAQGRQHDGHRSGRHPDRSVANDQIPRHRPIHFGGQPERGGRGGIRHQHAHPTLSQRGSRGLTRPRQASRPTAPCKCGSSTSTRF